MEKSHCYSAALATAPNPLPVQAWGDGSGQEPPHACPLNDKHGAACPLHTEKPHRHGPNTREVQRHQET